MTLKELAGGENNTRTNQFSRVREIKSFNGSFLEYIAITLNTSVEYLMETEKHKLKRYVYITSK